MRRFWATAAIVGLVAASVTLGATQADAVSGPALCSTYDGCAALGMNDHGYEGASGTSYWKMTPGHNCTNYVAYILRKQGASKSRPWSNKGNGNASAWGYYLSDVLDKNPVVGSVAWWGANKDGAGAAGHVAYVEAVIAPDLIVVSEDNYGGEFYWKVLRATDANWPTGFLHVADKTTSGTVPDWRAVPSTISYQVGADAARPVDPAHVKPGTTVLARVSLVNSGRQTWTGVTLQPEASFPTAPTPTPAPTATATASPGPTPTPTATGAATMLESSVPTGGTATFLVPITVPAGAIDFTQISLALHATGAAGEAIQFGDVTLGVTADSRDYLESTPKPYITGTLVQGSTLTATAGTWAPSSVALAYQWSRDGVAIGGATGATYVLGDPDVGHRISVSVTGSAAGYIPATTSSASMGPIATIYQRSVWAGEAMAGGKLVSRNLAYMLLARPNGAVAIVNRTSGVKVWSSGKVHAARLALRVSGRMVALDASGHVVWRTPKVAKLAKAVLTDKGVLRLVDERARVRWSTKR